MFHKIPISLIIYFHALFHSINTKFVIINKKKRAEEPEYNNKTFLKFFIIGSKMNKILSLFTPLF